MNTTKELFKENYKFVWIDYDYNIDRIKVKGRNTTIQYVDIPLTLKKNTPIETLATLFQHDQSITHTNIYFMNSFLSGRQVSINNAKRVLVEILKHKKNLLGITGLESHKLNKTLEDNRRISIDLENKLLKAELLSEEEKIEIIQRKAAICYFLDKDLANSIEAQDQAIGSKQLLITKEQYFNALQRIEDIHREVYANNFMRIKEICNWDIAAGKIPKSLENSPFSALPKEITKNIIGSYLYDEYELKSFVQREEYRRNKITLPMRAANWLKQSDPMNIAYPVGAAICLPIIIITIISLSTASLSMPLTIAISVLLGFAASSSITSYTIHNFQDRANRIPTPYLDYETVRG